MRDLAAGRLHQCLEQSDHGDDVPCGRAARRFVHPVPVAFAGKCSYQGATDDSYQLVAVVLPVCGHAVNRQDPL